MKRRKAANMAKRLWSIFTGDMDHCYFTGSPEVERHHVFGAANRSRSEVYGYVIPLHPTLHPNGAMFKRTKENLKIDKYLKQRCQRDYEKNHGSRADFIKEFGESYL